MFNVFNIGILFFLFCSTSTFAFFESSEHIVQGNDVKLFFIPNDAGQTGLLLHLPNGLNLTYGDALALGDFYGIPPISQGQSKLERENRFLATFNTFAQHADEINETMQILNVMHDEQEIIADGIKQGKNPEIIYPQIANEMNRRLNCITGGGCLSRGWWLIPGKYLKLQSINFDHFGIYAWLTYAIGHELAINEAIKAHQTHDLRKLELAYAMNAFASHFLADLFASGHMRTPRLKLAGTICSKRAGLVLANFMHYEENLYGLHVHNRRGDHWIAYGDRSFFTKKNAMNNNILKEALQTSVNQIFSAYLQGVSPQDDTVHELLPEPDAQGNESSIDIAPLFYWDNKLQKLMRRVDINNVSDRHWTSNWNGWGTLLALSTKYKLPIPLEEMNPATLGCACGASLDSTSSI